MLQTIPQPSEPPFKLPVLTPNGKDPVPLGSGIITKLLGSGGMASVYEIWNQQLEIYRAIKLMHPNCSDEALQRFQTEIKITAKIHHPNIVAIHGVGAWNNLPYIEMEKAEGITLEALLRQRGALPIDVCIAIGILAMRALNYAHNHKYMLYNKTYHGIIHRDLKPGNIMISSREFLKLMDFGIARPADASFHTIDGTVLGTLQYLSPEQLLGLNLDIRTDIYSLGTCLYEAACGNFAFPETNITHLLSDKAKNHFRPLNNYSIHLPKRFITIIHRCMNQDRAIRPQTAARLCEELEQLLHKLTLENPERIIAAFMETQVKEKQVVSTVNRVSTKSFFLVIAPVLIAIAGTAVFFNSTFQKKATPVIDEKNKITIISDKPVSDTPLVSNIPIANTPKKNAKINTTKIVPKVQTLPEVKTTKPVVSFLQTLYIKHNTQDLLQVMNNEYNLGNYATALTVFDSLPPRLATNPEAIVIKLRALKKSDQKSLASFLQKISLSEGEVLLEQARLAYNQGRIDDSEALCDKSLGAFLSLISYDMLVKEVFYLKALCATSRFDSNPDDKNWKYALEKWYNVKKEMRAQPAHSYFIAADHEIVRIGEKFRAATR